MMSTDSQLTGTGMATYQRPCRLSGRIVGIRQLALVLHDTHRQAIFSGRFSLITAPRQYSAG
jgi:hypothetical protein